MKNLFSVHRLKARWIVFLVLAAAFFARAQSTSDSSSTDYESFQVIVQRNIFDPNRYPHTSSYHRRETYRGVPTFSLAGTMSYRKGMFAFFNGTSDNYQKALQVGGRIAGYTVSKINFEGVELQLNGQTTNMVVGAAMQQDGNGWMLVAPGIWSGESSSTETETSTETQSTNESTNETSVTTPAPAGEPNDVLKKLMEQRAQELK